jgi:hypothetical protein
MGEDARAGVASASQSSSRRSRAVVWAVVALVGALGAASLAWIYSAHLSDGPPIRTDGEGYYLYLPAAFIDHDLTLRRTIVRRYGDPPLSVPGIRRVSSASGEGRLLDKYPVGEAVMLVPFFTAGEGVALAAGSDTGGYSRPYQVTAAVGGLVYMLLGLALVGHLLLRWFSRMTVVVTLLATTFGTVLFHHATYDSILSHTYSFFLVAVIIRLSLSLWESPRRLTAFALGAAGGLITIVRPTNIVVLLIPLLIGVTRVRHISQRARAVARQPALVLLGVAAFLVTLIPQIAYWRIATGRLVLYTYGNEHLDLLHPHLGEVLFSVRKGLFFWSPLLLLAVAGLPFLRRLVPQLFLPAVVFLVVDAWVISSWDTWWYGSSFGMRPFVEASPVFALGLAAALQTVRGTVTAPLVRAGVAFTTFLSLHAMIAYWRGSIPFDGTTWHVYVRSFSDLWPG